MIILLFVEICLAIAFIIGLLKYKKSNETNETTIPSTLNLNYKNKYSQLVMLRAQKYNIAAMEGLGMKWYKFNIYFRLFFTVFRLLVDIANATDLWKNNWITDVYLYFTVTFDVIFIIGIILTRHWLAYFNKKGIQFYFIIQYLSQIILVVAIYLIWGLNEEILSQTLAQFIGYGILLAFEYKYWKKRIHLFNKA